MTLTMTPDAKAGVAARSVNVIGSKQHSQDYFYIINIGEITIYSPGYGEASDQFMDTLIAALQEARMARQAVTPPVLAEVSA